MAHKKHAMCGRSGLLLYSLTMILFIILELVGGVMWLGYAGQIEIKQTGNSIIDEANANFQDFVDRRINCTFNYCCQGFTDTTTDKPKNLNDIYFYNVISSEGGLVGRKQGTADVDDSRSRAQAYLSAANLIPNAVDDEWRTTSVGHDGQENRTVWSQQYYGGFDIVSDSVLNSTWSQDWATSEAIKSGNPNPSKEQVENILTDVLAQLSLCTAKTASSDDLGNTCWIKWKSMCPKPLGAIKKASWDEICTFVGTRETWEFPDTAARPNTKDPKEREPMLSKPMCNSIDGKGVTDPDYGFKAAVIWKVQRSISIAAGIISLAVIQMLLLVTVCCAICHRAHAGGVVDAVDMKSADESGGASVKQSEGDNEDDINDEHL
jgi:hypothetical protein